MYHPPGIIVENIYSTIDMSARSELPIPTKSDTQSEASFRLVLLHHFCFIVSNIPYYYLAIMRCTSQELTIIVKCQGPYFSNFSVIGDFCLKSEVRGFLRYAIDFYGAFKTRGGKSLASKRARDMVAS